MVLLNGPVQNALFCLMDRYRNVCVWFMARNCRRLELTVANVGTTGYHCKELPVPIGSVRSHGSQPGNQRLPLQATAGYFGVQHYCPRRGVKVWWEDVQCTEPP